MAMKLPLPLPIILVIIPVSLLVLFGRDPYAERQAEMKKYGDDPLVAEISRLNEEGSSSSKTSALGDDFLGLSTKVSSGEQEKVDDFVSRLEDKVGTAADNLVVDGQGIVRPAGTPGAVAPAPAPAPSNYYPPIVGDTLKSPDANLAGDFRLRSGQRIGFEDNRVFTTNATGERVPLPDGNYVMMNGTSLEVQNGRRVGR
jgi:hypothetical protein